MHRLSAYCNLQRLDELSVDFSNFLKPWASVVRSREALGWAVIFTRTPNPFVWTTQKIR